MTAAEQIFSEIFGKLYRVSDADQSYTMQEIMSRNPESESNDMVQHIFEELDNPETLKAS
jgi:hypothetical protein